MSEADLAEVWARSLDELAGMQIEPAHRAWLQLTRPLGLVENTALIATPNEFVKEQLETRLRALITNTLSRELGRSIQLAVTVDPTATAAAPSAAAAAARPRRAGPGPARRPGRPRARSRTAAPRPPARGRILAPAAGRPTRRREASPGLLPQIPAAARARTGTERAGRSTGPVRPSGPR